MSRDPFPDRRLVDGCLLPRQPDDPGVARPGFTGHASNDPVTDALRARATLVGLTLVGCILVGGAVLASYWFGGA